MGANEHCVAGKQPSQRVQLVTNEAAQLNSDSLLRDAMRAAAFARKLALLDLAARHASLWHRSHYNPNQPRVPAGNPDGGQWTSTAAGAGNASRLAQADGPPKTPPRIPKQKPRTRDVRMQIAMELAEWVRKNSDVILDAANWIVELLPTIQASFDPPKTLQELHHAVANPQPGYDIHQIVEQTSAEQDGFPRSVIDALENLVRIPRWKHWQINGWYMQKNDAFGGLSPRDYLRGKGWSERRRVGLEALIRYGVLKP